MSIFDKFENGFNNDAMKEAIKRAEENNNGGEFKNAPTGNYEVAVEKLELGTTQNGDPKLVAWFKIVAGEYKGSYLFKNSILKEDWQIDKVFKFLNDLQSGVVINGAIKNDEDFDNYLADILDAIQVKGLEYEVKYFINKAGFGDVTEILQVFAE